jgi:hypothetical protein
MSSTHGPVSGLSDNDARAAAQLRARLLESEEGRQALRQQVPDVELAALKAGDALDELAEILQSPDPVAVEVARHSLQHLAAVAAWSAWSAGSSDSSATAMWRVDRGSTTALGWVRDRTKRWRLRAERHDAVWSAVAHAATFAAACLAAAGLLFPAAVLLAVRLVGSLTLLRSLGLPGDDDVHDGPSRFRVTIRGCVASHVTDAVVLAGVAVHLTRGGRPLWGLVVMAVALVMLTATLYRTSVLQAAVWIKRSAFERVARGGAMVAGLLAAAAWQAHPPASGVPIVAAAAAGTLGFALAEIVTVDRSFHRHARRQIHGEDAFADAIPITVGLVARAQAEVGSRTDIAAAVLPGSVAALPGPAV